MNSEVLIRVLSAITSRFKKLPESNLLVPNNNGTLGLVQAHVVSDLDVAETDDDITTLQDNDDPFIDLRSMVLYTRVDDLWEQEHYGGQRPLLRPGTLCRSRWNQKVYYCDNLLRLRRVNLTDAATPT